MYNNLLNGVNGQLSQVQQQQQQQYLLTEFLKTAEGQEAHQEFIEAQTKWLVLREFDSNMHEYIKNKEK